MQTGINDLKSYEKSCSLKELADKAVDELLNILRRDNPDEIFVIGFHIRHFLDSTSPTYVARHSDISYQNELDIAIENNKNEGRHTFNHLIDSLYYQKDNLKDVFIQTKISLGQSNETEQNFVSDAITAKGKLQLQDLPDDQGEVKEMFFDMLPALHNFCVDVGIDHNIVNLKAIHNSIVQLIPFKKYGHFSDVFVIRPNLELGYVVGFTIIRKKKNFEIKNTFEKLKQYFNYLNYKKKYSKNILSDFRESESYSIYQIENSKGISYHDKQRIPKEIILSIISNITKTSKKANKNYPFKNLTSQLKNENDFEKNPLYKSLQSFLSILYEFSDEQVEGRKITYGFVLGNPGLFDFLEGKNVFPSITDGSNKKFLDLDGYKTNYHLFAKHLETALVMPYTDAQLGDDSNFPFFFMNMKNFEEDIFNWKYGSLIPIEYRPYAYVSYRFPWAVSAVVGPGSQIRVFSNGVIIAFKDGKGWKVYGDAINMLKKCNCWTDNLEKEKIEKFLGIVCLLSPIYNIDSHGGFVTFNNDIPNDKLSEFENSIQALTNQEPKWQNDCKWLKSRSLFTEKDKENTVKIDYEVAQRLIQISVLDGATLFSGKDYEIRNFGMRLNFKAPASKKNYGGTKTKSARDFIEWCKANGIKKSFAIAISSDGPLKIFHPQFTDKNGLTPLYIYNKI